jgi:hypothetical protein
MEFDTEIDGVPLRVTYYVASPEILVAFRNADPGFSIPLSVLCLPRRQEAAIRAAVDIAREVR